MIKEWIPMFIWIPYYCLRQRFWRKHHVIQTGLPKWDWHDTQYRMLYGMMSLLMQFIKDEEPLEKIEWDSDEGHAKARDDFVSIQKWWLDYDRREKEIDTQLTAWCKKHSEEVGEDWLKHINEERKPLPEADKLFEELHAMEEALEIETTDMLCRLVKIRGYLWT